MLPQLTADLPGTGGSLVDIDDFVVEELPAYLPCGEGEHCLALIQKRELTTPQAVKQICEELKLNQREAGYAGLKDKRGVTQQWISFFKTEPEALMQIQHDNLKVLEAKRHGNKIRTGHLRGNRFTITLHQTEKDSLKKAEAIFHQLVECGLPNFYGEQRFGRNNAEQGMAILRGDIKMPRDRFKRRLLISAAQSSLFNDVLTQRLHTLNELMGGEVLQRTDSHGIFVSEDKDTDDARLKAKEVVITGPMCSPARAWSGGSRAPIARW